MTPSFFDGKRDGSLESDQNQVKSTDHTRGDAEVSADPVSVFTAGDAGRECNYCDTQTKTMTVRFLRLFCFITDLIARGSGIVGLFVFSLLLPKKHKLIRGQ